MAGASSSSSSSSDRTRIMLGVNESSLKGYPHASISSRGAFEWTLQKIVRNNTTGFKILFLHVQVPDEDADRTSSRFRKLAGVVSKPVPLASSSSAEVGVEEEEASVNGDLFPEGLSRDLMPRHVAVIMDGNGRWAKARRLHPSAGHQEGVRVLKEMV